MGRYGKGLGKEFALAVIRREVPEVFNTEKLRRFIEKRDWNPSVNYVNVLLANSASATHSKMILSISLYTFCSRMFELRNTL